MRKAIILIFALALIVPTVFAGWTDGLILYLDMSDASGNLTNNISQHNAFAPTGTPGYQTSGKNGNAITFSGDDHFSIPFDAETVEFVSPNFTVSLWVKPSLVPQNSGMLSNGLANGNTLSWHISHPNAAAPYTRTTYDGNQNNGVAAYGTDMIVNKWYHIIITYNGTDGVTYFWQNGTQTISSAALGGTIYQTTNTFYVGLYYSTSYKYQGIIDEIAIWNRTLTNSEITSLYNGGAGLFYDSMETGLDTTPPSITYFNLTSSDNGCENWNNDKNSPCSTSSITPTLQFNTNENAWCAIAGSSSSASLNINYTEMGSSRNCTGAASGEGAIEHFCTLALQDELVYDTSYLFISCKDSSNNMNRSGTSTSGPLKVSITSLESNARNLIGSAVQNALLSGYTNYTDLQIYARNLSNAQSKGTFDKAVKKGSKMWAFNRIGVSDSHVNMFNLTPVLYTLEFANLTSARITNMTELMINATK